MCGRYDLHESASEIANLFKIGKPLLNFGARYNIAPTQDAPIVRVGKDGQRELAMLRWGLIPSWAEDARIGYKMINARAETVAERPAVRAAFKHRRCLVPATGYFE